MILGQFGLEDAWPVVAEDFKQWVRAYLSISIYR